MKKKNTETTTEKLQNDGDLRWTAAHSARAVRIGGLPAGLQRVLRNVQDTQKMPAKVLVSIRLSSDVVATLRASGAGWQTRVDDILRKHM